ncbi:MAG TPA: cell division protein FtsA [Eubacteriaceae bacterium]|nr:cell division protein FtsA [Eubacteriaceae bacterium]
MGKGESMASEIENKQLIFALDIGTRNVVGLVGYEEEEQLKIIATSTYEHKSRAMMDGQIHDIVKVSRVIKEVKKELEQEIGHSLEKVSIAAAGRVLRTVFSEPSIVFREKKVVEKSHVLALELQGVESAKQILYDEDHSLMDYFCVAHTPIRYYLDGFELDNLQGHKGQELKAVVLSTFLPQQVIDSLYRAVEAAGLEVSMLTLEPISAMNVAIPKDLRLLNLALVDIGAGTSDIAITKEGTVASYGMLSIAGDEFTEKIIEEYLVDFQTAEKMKKLRGDESVEVKDILGMQSEIQQEEISKVLDPLLQKITEEIAAKILDLNGEQAPKAVFCVGGGSKLQHLTDILSEKLDMPKSRVIVKEVDFPNERIRMEGGALEGPEYITPIGIAYTTLLEQKDNFLKVQVNEKRIQLLNTKKLTIMDAAIKANVSSAQMVVKNGKDLRFEWNGMQKIEKGTMGEQPVIKRNGKDADLKQTIQSGDEIEFVPAVAGKDAQKTIQDGIEEKIPVKSIFFGEKKIDFDYSIRVNGKQVNRDYAIQNGDQVECHPINTLEEFADWMNIQKDRYHFAVNGVLRSLESTLQQGDRIEVVEKPEEEKKPDVKAGQEAERVEDDQKIEKNPFEALDVTVNGETVTLKGKKEYLFVNIFNFLDFDVRNGKKNIRLFLNGEKASYTDKLQEGDDILIQWDEC